jgi:hypothetical protein
VTTRIFSLLVIAGAALVSACAGESRAASAEPASGDPTYAGVVDSALPIPVLLDRFRRTVVDTPSVLVGGAESPLDLVTALLGAVARHDTASLRALVLDRAEFAWLYFPDTKFTAPPYELGPELVWLQQGMASESGVVRLLNRFGGRSLRLLTLSCPDAPSIEGDNRIVGGCRVRFSVADAPAQELKLFGALLNRDGRYKFLSYANDL